MVPQSSVQISGRSSSTWASRSAAPAMSVPFSSGGRGASSPPRVQSAPTRSLDLGALRAAAQAFARDEMRPVALSYDETEEYPLPVLRRAAALGLTSYDLPAEYGGGGVERLRDRCEVIEELS